MADFKTLYLKSGPAMLKLSPNVRLRLTAQREMALDTKRELFTDELHQKYLRMHHEALNRQNAQLKTTILADAGLAMLLFGKNVTIPGTSLGIQDIPAAVEVFTALAAFGFLMVSLSFLNAQCYMAVIDQFNIRKAQPFHVDPDFLSAGDTFTELYLKAFRATLNIHGPDFYEAGKGFKAYYTTLTVMLMLAMSSLLVMHIAVVMSGAWASLSSDWLSKLFAGSIALLTVVSVLVNILIDFPFTPLKPQEDLVSETD